MEKWLFGLCMAGGTLVGAAALAPRVVHKPTVLQVESLPPLAEVWVDGQLQGKTPLSLEVKPGTRHLELRKSGYVARDLQVDCEPAQLSSIVERLSASSAHLSVKSLKKDEELWLGPGTPVRLKGSGPWPLPPGDYELTARRGKLPAEPRRFTLQPGQELTVALQWPVVPSPAVTADPEPPRPRAVGNSAPVVRPSAPVNRPRRPAARPAAPRPYTPPAVEAYRRPVYTPPAYTRRPAASRPRAVPAPAPAPLWTPLPPPPPVAAPVAHPPEESLFTPLP